MSKRLDFDMVTTRTGDNGKSALFSGEVYFKDDVVFEALGELDHLNSLLGEVKARLDGSGQKQSQKFIDSVQTDILALSALIATNPATPDGERLYDDLRQFDNKDTERLEKMQKRLFKTVEIQPVFVNPGENEIASSLDIARSQARKAERRIVQVIREKVRPDLHDVQRYVNRLSDVLFTMARMFAQLT